MRRPWASVARKTRRPIWLLAILTSGTCMTGWIDHPLKPVSMTERWLLNPDRGGVLA